MTSRHKLHQPASLHTSPVAVALTAVPALMLTAKGIVACCTSFVQESVGEIRLGGLESYEIRNNPDLSSAFSAEEGP